MKKIKIILALAVVLLAASHSTKAQSAQSLEKQLRNELDKRKQRRDAVILKAKEQQKQQEAGRTAPGNNATSQGTNANTVSGQNTSQVKPGTNSTTNTPATQQQNVANTSAKKEG